MLKDIRLTDRIDTDAHAYRRSARILAQKEQKAVQSKEDQKNIATPKKAPQNRRTPNKVRSKSVETPLKSILTKGNRRGNRGRSKSVSFVVNENSSDEVDFIARRNTIPVRRRSFANDCSIQTPVFSDSMQANAHPSRAHSADGCSIKPNLLDTMGIQHNISSRDGGLL